MAKHLTAALRFLLVIIWGLGSIQGQAHAMAPMCSDVHLKHKEKASSFASALDTEHPDAALDKIFQVIDQTAAEFRGSASFISPREWRAKTARSQLPALDLPADVGGLGWSASKMVKVFEHAGKYNLNLRDVVGGAHSRALLISQEPEIRNIVRQVAEGKGYVAIAITEEESGSNMRSMSSKSERTTGGYLITGKKFFNARLASATHVIIFTQSADLAEGKLNVFAVPIDYPGLSFRQVEAHGLNGNSFGGVSFDHVFIPEKFRIGQEGEGGKIFNQHFMYWRLMMAASAIGTAKGALEQIPNRLRSRVAFGAPIGRFTHLQQPLAQHTAMLDMATLLVEKAAMLYDQQKYTEANKYILMAKGEGVEMSLQASMFAMEVFGASSYSPDLTDLSGRVADLTGLRFADGTTHVMRSALIKTLWPDLYDMIVSGGD